MRESASVGKNSGSERVAVEGHSAMRVDAYGKGAPDCGISWRALSPALLSTGVRVKEDALFMVPE